MSGKVRQHVEDKQERQSYDLESLKRELWMRVLGMKAGTPTQPPAEPKSINEAATGPNGQVISH